LKSCEICGLALLLLEAGLIYHDYFELERRPRAAGMVRIQPRYVKAQGDLNEYQ
jgi:hypothetical protein